MANTTDKPKIQAGNDPYFYRSGLRCWFGTL